MKNYTYVFYVFYVFWKSKKHDFLRFFELLRTFSRTLAFIDIRYRSGIETPLTAVGWGWALHASPYGTLRPNVTSSVEPEVHNVAHRRQRKTEPRPQGNCITHFMKIGPAVPKICLRIDRQTDKLIAILCYPTGAEKRPLNRTSSAV